MTTRAAARASLLIAVFLAAVSGAPADQAPSRNLAGPGDYTLREMIVTRLNHDPELAKERIVVVMVNGGAVFSGQATTRSRANRALRNAASIRGVINVTDQIQVPRADLPDAAIEKAVVNALQSAAESIDLKDLKVTVQDGVATLGGAVRSVPARVSAEDVAGSVVGVTRISNHLAPSDAPSGKDDAALLRAVVAYLSDWHAFPHQGDIGVSVKEGTVTLSGRVPYFLARQQAAVATSLIGGVSKVENRLKVDLAFPLPRPGMTTAVVRAKP